MRATRRPAGNARDLLFAACAVAAWALLRVFARNDTGAEIGSGYATVAALCALGVAVAVTRPALPLFRSEESVEHAGGRLEG